jgi:hypothetical protein
MKIDRVLLSTNKDPMYYGFWNNLSFTYKEKFGITPTLIFFGTENDVNSIGLSREFGEILCQEPIKNVNNWQYTWSLFYFTKFFQNEICLTMGIDQIPLGTHFLKDLIKDISDEKYVMLIDNHYVYLNQSKDNWDTGGVSQTAYHISKGETFNKIYNFEQDFEDEIYKIQSLKLKTMWGNDWGMDETYSSKILYEYKERQNIVTFKKAGELIRRRVECFRNQETNYDLNLLKNNHYIECHSCRPFSSHKDYLTKLFNNIPYYI